MKKLLILLPLLLMALGLSACHKHAWKDANCTRPKTCLSCSKTEGSPLGHVWEKATCTKPKTCTDCGHTEGYALGHTWENATCYSARTCTICGTKEGSALGHRWKDATCSTPMTCSFCGKESGSVVDHNWKAATCSKPKVCTYCNLTEGATLAHTWKDATCISAKTCSTCGTREGSPLGHSWETVNSYTKKCKTCSTKDVDQNKTPVKLGSLTLSTGGDYYKENYNTKDIYGNEFTEGLYTSFTSYIFDENPKSAEYVLNKTYKTFTTTALVSSGSDDTFEGRLKIYIDDVLVYDSHTVGKKTQPLNIEIDVSNAMFIKIEVTKTYSNGCIMLADPMLCY